MKTLILICLFACGTGVYAENVNVETLESSEALTPSPEADMNFDREPATALTQPNVPSLAKRTYPGGSDEEDLQVQAKLPEYNLKTDARSLQRDVYKTLYNQELKDDGRENVEE